MAFIKSLPAKGVRRGLLWLSLIVLPLLGLAEFFQPDRIPGDLGDARFNMFVLEHGYRWLTGQESSFWHADFFYPSSDKTIAYSDSHIGNLPIYAALRLVGLPYDRAFQVWIIISFLLNFASAFFVLRRLTPSLMEGAILGAFVFAFGLPVLQQLGHIQLIPRYFIPPAFLFLHRFFREGRHSGLLYVVASVVAQFLVSIYTGVFLVFGLSLFTALYIALSLPAVQAIPLLQVRRRPCCKWNRAELVAAASAFVVAGLTLFFYLHPYYDVGLTHVRSWDEVLPLLPTPASYLLPADKSMLWSWMKALLPTSPTDYEYRMFPGLLPTASTILLLISARKRKGLQRDAFPLLTLIAWFLLILLTIKGPKELSLYSLIFNYLPGISALRAVARISLLFAFFAGLMTAWATNRLIAFARIRSKNVLLHSTIYFFLATAIVADQWTTNNITFSLSESRQRIETVVTQLKRTAKPNPAAFYLEANGQPFFITHVDAMLASQLTGIPTVNGYSGNHPQDYSLELLLDEPSEHLCRAIAGWLMLNGRRQQEDIRIIGGHSCGISGESIGDQGYNHDRRPDDVHGYPKRTLRFENESVVFRMNDPSMRTIVGAKKGLSILSTAQTGVLVFGPYTSLPSGNYSVTWEGYLLEGSAAHSQIKFDVAGLTGKELFASDSIELKELQKKSVPFRRRIVFRLNKPTPNVEFRIFVHEGVRLQVDTATLAPENDSGLPQ